MSTIANLVISVKSDQAKVATNRLGLLKKAAAGVVAVLGTRQIIKYADTYSELSNKLRLVTDDSKELAKAQKDVFEIAQNSRQPIASIAELYRRISQNAGDSIGNQEELNDVVQTIAKSLEISGASTESANAALVQLSQGLASGTLRGEEFNSVVEQTPRLAKVFADGLGLTINEMRELSKQGKLTSDELIKAAKSQSTLVAAEFASLTPTINKSFTMVQNSFTQLVGKINEDTGASGIIAQGISNLADFISSPQLLNTIIGFIDGVKGIYLQAASFFDGTSSIIGETIGNAFELGGTIAGKAIEFIKQAFFNLPVNIKAAMQLGNVEVFAFVDKSIGYFKAFGQVLGIQFAKLVQKAKVYGKAISNALNPFADDYDLESNLKRLDQLAADSADRALKAVERRADAVAQARRDSIIAIIDERQATIDKVKSDIAAEKEATKAKQQENEKRLAALKATAEKENAIIRSGRKQPLSKEDTENFDRNQKKFANLVNSLRTEEEVIEQSYEKRKNIILKNTKEGSELRKKLILRLDKELVEERANTTKQQEFNSLVEQMRTEEQVISDSYNKRLQIIKNNTQAGTEQQEKLLTKLKENFKTESFGDLLTVPDTFEEQINKLNDFYNRRRELILSNTELTETERTNLETELTKQRNQRLEALERQRQSAIYSASSSLFGGLADIAKNYAGEQSGIYKGMFAVSKAFAIADSIIKIQQGIANAAANPFPANIAAIGSVVAATSSIVSTISGTNFSGAYDKGGMIPAGKFGLVGEFGPEFVKGPANVTSRKDTAKKLDDITKSNNNLQQQPNNVKIINVGAEENYEEYLTSDAGEEVLLNFMQKNKRVINGF